MQSRVEQRDKLMTELGMLAAPIQNLLRLGTVSPRDVPFLESQFANDLAEYGANVDTVCRCGELFFQRECNDARDAARPLGEFIRHLLPPDADVSGLRTTFERRLERARAAIRTIPCDDPDTILPAASPFKTYMRLRAHCTGATSRIDIFDPYLDPSVFYLYAGQVPPAAVLTIVADNGSGSPIRNASKRAAIVAVSQLVAHERKDKYRFYVAPSIHDRYLRADDMILHLGGSIAHAGRNDPYTISTLDPSNTTHATLDGIIANADEWYGQSVTSHRTQ